MQIWCVTTDYCRSLKKKLSPITSGMNDSPNYNNHNRKCHCENITNNSIDVCDVCEMQQSERDVSVLVFWEKLKSPPATVSGESQDSPALGTAACRPAVTSHLSTLQSPVKNKIKRQMIVRRIWETDWTTSTHRWEELFTQIVNR